MSINNKKVTGDALSESHHALSSQDGKISLMDYRPLLQLVRNGRQDYRFNRHAAVPVYHEDDYGRTNEIPNPSVIAPVSQGNLVILPFVFYMNSMNYNMKNIENNV